MSELHDNLKELGPIDWSDVPTDNLGPYLKHLFEVGELVCNSVPHPPGGTDFSSSKVTTSKPDSASSSKEISNSDARPLPAHPDHADLHSSWGKPIKLAAKDNPLGITVYKMAGKDRKGAWFARRSVHEGLSFTKFKRAMQREFPESLAVQGGPGEGNVRGIGGDQRLERKKVEGVGQMEVFQLSAQFPGPTTPREFITLLSTSETALTEKSHQDIGGKKRAPRHFMVVSNPVTHPEAPERSGYIRGTYESVEMIREIPLHPSPEGKDNSSSGDHELNPVEWIMVTRSEPGGGIPRFMVERGTPSSIVADTSKFFDWACGKDEIPDPDADEDKQNAAQAQHSQAQQPNPQQHQVTGTSQNTTSRSQQPANQPAQGGVVSSITNAFEAGIDAYAPVSVANYTRSYLHQDEAYDSSSSSDSDSSFASAQDFPVGQKESTSSPGHRASVDTMNTGNISTTSLPSTSSTKDLSSHDKELRKIEQQKEKITEKLAKKREAEDEKLVTMKQKDSADHAKAVEKHDNNVRKLEEKRQKELAKIEHKREKELKKAEKRRQKNADQATMSQVSRERDDFRSQLEMLKRENISIKEKMEHLQQENAILVDRLSKHGGAEVLKEIQHDVVSGR